MAYLHILLQPELSKGAAEAVSTATGGGSPATGCGAGTPLDMLILPLMFVAFYLLFLRPQQKRMREAEKVREGIKKGDIVRTSGGIRGEVVNLEDNDVTLQIAERTRIKVLRSHIAQLEGSESK